MGRRLLAVVTTVAADITTFVLFEQQFAERTSSCEGRISDWKRRHGSSSD